MEIVAVELGVAVVAPLVFASIALIHDLRGARHDVRSSVLIAGGIWSGIAVGAMMLVALLVSEFCVR